MKEETTDFKKIKDDEAENEEKAEEQATKRMQVTEGPAADAA